MVSIDVQLDRLVETSNLLLQMCKAYDSKEFWALSKKFDALIAFYKLEDELNGERSNRTAI